MYLYISETPLELYRYIEFAYRKSTHNKVSERLQEHQFLGISPGESIKMELNSGLRERMILKSPKNIACRVCFNEAIYILNVTICNSGGKYRRILT